MGTSPDVGFMIYYKVLGSLLLVLAVLVVVAYGLKRWSRFFGQSSPNDRIQILTRLPLGPKHHLVLIQIQEQQWLIGVSPDGVRLLTSVDQPVESQALEAATPAENQPRPRFQSVLNRFIGPRS
jgi:flagellar protein FliO/FliZ